MLEPTEVPDGVTTVSCKNLLKTRNFLREKIVRLHHIKYFRNTELPEGKKYYSLLVLISWQLCSESSVGMKTNLFFIIMA